MNNEKLRKTKIGNYRNSRGTKKTKFSFAEIAINVPSGRKDCPKHESVAKKIDIVDS